MSEELVDRPLTAMKPDREATFLRLLVELPSADGQAEDRLRAVVRETMGLDASGTPWMVAPLFEPDPGGPDRLLGRFFAVTGHVVATPTYPLQHLAFELARGLTGQGVGLVQPDLPSSAYAPVAPPGRPGEPSFSAGGRPATHLPGAAAEMWALDKVRCRQAWTLPAAGGAQMGAGIVIGHPDTGFTDHPELEPDMFDLARDWDIINNDGDAHDPLERRWWFPLDSPGHGTSTASVLAGRQRGRITGVAPLATVVPLRTVKSVVQVFDGDVAKAIERARTSGCHVISMSLGGVGFFSGLQAAIRRAVADGLIVCAAAGNKVGFVVAPARFPECVAVAATNADDRRWDGSSHGPEVDVSAPGESVWVADLRLDERPPRYDVSQHSGTSFAVTHVAGVAALWLAHHGREALIARYGRGRLQAAFLHLVRTPGSRQPPGWDASQYGVGIIDAVALLQAPLPNPDQLAAAPAAAAVAARSAPLDRLHALFPELSRDELAGRLAKLLDVDQQHLNEQLEFYGAELAYLAAEDELVRRRLAATGPALSGATGRPDRADVLALAASPSLASRIARTARSDLGEP